jgi:DnaJ-class molecular chaperone
MKNRTFYVALGVPRGAEPEAVQAAYRRVVTRYRRLLQTEADAEDEPTQPPLRFAVQRPYSERRHGVIFDEPEPLAASPGAEVDRFFGGVVPEVEPARARRAGKDLYVELRIDASQARTGGIFAVHVPVLQRCLSCQDADENRLACPVCQGAGSVTVDRVVDVTVPPGVSHRQVARVAMEDVGLEETDLLVMVLTS